MKAYSVPGLSQTIELDIISNWAKDVPANGVIVEVGSLFGRTSVALAEGADPSVTIYCIDYFDEAWSSDTTDLHPKGVFEKGTVFHRGDEFKKYTSEYKNIIQLTNKKLVYPYDKEPIDLFFLDATHMNPNDMHNLIYFKKFFKKNTLICGHDYSHKFFPDVVRNVHILESLYKTKAKLYERSSLWSIRIPE